jgi:hypothetical protein
VQVRLVVDSYSPANTGDVEVVATSISIDPAVFEALDEQGRYDLSGDDPGAVLLTLAEVDTDDALVPLKLCFVGVPDFDRPSALSVCDAAAFEPTAGAELRVFANLAIERDPEVVASTLSAFGLPPCLCPDEDGVWGACPDEE